MTKAFEVHSAFIMRFGLMRWMLRECVRANPLYVISAALTGYGILKLNEDIDPQIGKTGGILAVLLLINLYEYTVLAVATIVLKHRQTEGGRDLHGLMLVAALFLGGALLALDELIVLYPSFGWIIILTALILIYGKMSWYASLPGVYLPRRFRWVLLLILASHALSALLGDRQLVAGMDETTVQNLGWLPGWSSLIGVLWLIWHEHAMPVPEQSGRFADPLQTRWCGAWAIIVSTFMGIAHLFASDWVFDRPVDPVRILPSITILCACVMLLFWFHGWRCTYKAQLLWAAPALALEWIWWACPIWKQPFKIDILVSTTSQMFLAVGLTYVAMAWATRQRAFYLGLLALVAGPAEVLFDRARQSTPHFRALLSTVLGFIVLILGMLMSLFRRRLLDWIENSESEIT